MKFRIIHSFIQIEEALHFPSLKVGPDIVAQIVQDRVNLSKIHNSEIGSFFFYLLENDLLRVVPGIRHAVPADGNWHFAIAAPTLPANVTKPLYYVIRAYYEMGGQTSDAVTVKVYRAE